MARLAENPANPHWALIGFLSLFGILVSTYLFLFQTRKVKSLACPFFGKGCETVTTSPKAFTRRIPNSLVGMIGYSSLLGISILGLQPNKKRQPALAKATLGASLFSVGVSALATYEQAAKLKTWCFWCLTSAAVSSFVFLLSLVPFVERRKTPLGY